MPELGPIRTCAEGGGQRRYFGNPVRCLSHTHRGCPAKELSNKLCRKRERTRAYAFIPHSPDARIHNITQTRAYVLRTLHVSYPHIGSCGASSYHKNAAA